MPGYTVSVPEGQKTIARQFIAGIGIIIKSKVPGGGSNPLIRIFPFPGGRGLPSPAGTAEKTVFRTEFFRPSGTEKIFLCPGGTEK
jgi:hypothetical protein